MLANLSKEVRQYLLVTANYWAFTVTDGALRMLVILFFHQLGYSPLEIAMLLLFYEAFGVITNLVGGWLGARIGLNYTMNIGLALQIVALLMLTIEPTLLSVFWVMAAQALSGIAKDLNKMSAKSAIKLVVPEDADKTLFRWVAILTGSKNSLKGAGFFLGAILLSHYGFSHSVWILICLLAVAFFAGLGFLQNDLGKVKSKPKFTSMFSKSSAINFLSLARTFLFGARDVWFVVALPVYMASQFDWDHWQIGGYMAVWIILYGVVQTQAPLLFSKSHNSGDAVKWATYLALVTTALMLIGVLGDLNQVTLTLGLLVFGFFFAINSSLHSFLIVDYSDRDTVSMDVGFYYMANACGRLLGTVLSGWIYQAYGLTACLSASALMLAITAFVSLQLPKQTPKTSTI